MVDRETPSARVWLSKETTWWKRCLEPDSTSMMVKSAQNGLNGYRSFSVRTHLLLLVTLVYFLNTFFADQLNTTIHGTMKTTPHELVYGQPPRQNIFPGATGECINEEDVEDLFCDEPLPLAEKTSPPLLLNEETSLPPSKSCYNEGDMELYEGKLNLTVDGWQQCPVISLRQAAKLANPLNEFQAGRCNC